MTADEGLAWGFYNRVVEDVLAEAQALAAPARARPDLRPRGDQEAARRRMERVRSRTALEVEAQAQARCMETNDFQRAYEAFAAKQTPEFQGD